MSMENKNKPVNAPHPLRRADDALLPARKLAQSVLDALSAHICVLDENGAIILTNRAWNRFADENPPVPQNYCVGANYLDVCDHARGESSEGAREVAEGIRSLLRGEIQTFHMEYPCHSPETKRWFIFRATSFPENDSTRITIAHEDITLRMKNEEELRESQKRFSTIFYASPMPVALIRLDGETLLDVNQSWLNLTGFQRDEVIGSPLAGLNLYVDPELHRQMIGTLQEQGQSGHIEVRLRKKSGEVADALMSAEIIDLVGEACILSMALDITERKQAEEAVFRAQESYHSLFENALEGIFISLPEGRFADVNPAYARMLGYESPDELLETVTDIASQVYFEAERRAEFTRTMEEQGEVAGLELRLKRKDGGAIWVKESARAVRDPAGNLLYYEGSAEDVTARKQAEGELDKRATQMALLNEVGQKIAGVLDIQGVLDLTARLVHETFGYSHVALFTLDDDNHSLLMRSKAGLLARVFPQGFRIKLGDGMIGSTGKSGQMILSNCVSKEPRYKNKFPELINTASELSLPISVAGKVAGVLDVQSPEYDAFSSEDVTVLQTVASQVAVALENARLYEQARREIAERKRVEQELHERTRYTEMIMENAPIGFAVNTIDDGKVRFISSRFEEIYGIPRGVTTSVDAFFEHVYRDPVFREQIKARIMSDIARGDPSRMYWENIPVLQASGDIRYVTATNIPFPDQNLMVSTVRDVTERVRAEKALHESEARYRSLIENQFEVVARSDLQGRLSFVNDAYCRTFGKSREELIGRVFTPTVFPEDIPVSLNAVKSIIQSTHHRIHTETRHLTPQGIRWFEWENSAVLDKNGGVVELQGVGRDITERKRAEDGLRLRIAELQLLHENSVIFTQSLNSEEIAQKVIGLLGEKLDWHHTAIRLLDPRDDSLELVAFELPGMGGSTGDNTAATHLRKSVARVGEGLSGWALQQSRTLRLGDVTGDPHYVESFPGIHSGLYVPLRAGDHMLGVISVESEKVNAFSDEDEHFIVTLANQAAIALENARLYREISLHAEELEQRVRERTADLSRVNSDLARAMRVKDEFLASMSHELRTPLTGILGLSEALQLRVFGELNEKQLKALKNVETSGRHLLDLINDILDLSKIEAGKLEMQLDPCPVLDICQSSLQMVKGMVNQKKQDITFSMNPPVINVRADARRLKQMLVNLLSNAVKFTPEGGQLGLEVYASEEQKAVFLGVWDKGIGIEPEAMAKLFKPFTQLDSSLARQYSGTGLGLSLVQRMAELHGGSVKVESTPREGSRFTIVLPWSLDVTQPLRGLKERGTGPLKNALVIEDNDLDAEQVVRYLDGFGIAHVVHPAMRGALEKAALARPSAILLDLNLPDGSGLELLAELTADARTRDIPVIIVSVEERQAEAANLGAIGYLVKPFTRQELHDILSNAAAFAVPPSRIMVVGTGNSAPTVMIADDNEMTLEMLKDFLEARGCRVTATRNGFELMERASEEHPDIMLVDIQMPGMDGMETIRRLRAHGDPSIASTPIIAITALAMAGDREKCLQAGANEYMSKPVVLTRLIERIKEFLEAEEAPPSL